MTKKRKIRGPLLSFQPEAGRRSVGRPRQEAEPGERAPLSFRVTAELKGRLDTAANQSGRSQSQEAEFRLERSFDHQDLLSEALTLAYGRKLAGIIMALGFVMDGAARWAGTDYKIERDWTDKPERFEHAVQAAWTLLNAARPRGTPEPQIGDDTRLVVDEAHGRMFTKAFLEALRGDKSGFEQGDQIKRLLGPIAERMSPEYDRANPIRPAIAAQPGVTMAPRYHYLKLSLVSAPIVIYPAIEKVNVNTLSRATSNRQVEDDELSQIAIESTPTVDIEKFVPKASIDDRFRDTPYYLAPEGDRVDQEAFHVIRDAMKKKKVVAIAHVVMADERRILMLEPFGKGILGTLLHHPYEIRSEEAVFQEIHDLKLPDEMIRIAEVVIDKMTGDFEPDGLPLPKTATVEPTNVINLMDALKRLVA